MCASPNTSKGFKSISVPPLAVRGVEGRSPRLFLLPHSLVSRQENEHVYNATGHLLKVSRKSHGRATNRRQILEIECICKTIGPYRISLRYGPCYYDCYVSGAAHAAYSTRSSSVRRIASVRQRGSPCGRSAFNGKIIMPPSPI